LCLFIGNDTHLLLIAAADMMRIRERVTEEVARLEATTAGQARSLHYFVTVSILDSVSAGG
jgi:hypothetical protein